MKKLPLTPNHTTDRKKSGKQKKTGMLLLFRVDTPIKRRREARGRFITKPIAAIVILCTFAGIMKKMMLTFAAVLFTEAEDNHIRSIRSLLTLAAVLFVAAGSLAQKKDFSYKFYGQVRTDLYYNSRANQETVDGLFYMYPKDKNPDPAGKDLNATPNSNFYTLYSRLGVNITGPKLGNAATSAKVEADFRGTGSSFSVVRLRHAYFQMDRGKSSLLAGQTWHPLFGDVSPQILNLSVGAPFQPFSRAPQLRYRYTGKHIRLTGAAVWQSQYLSQGIDENNPMKSKKSQEYIKKSMVPELFTGIDYHSKHFLAGLGVEFLSMKPRTQATGADGKTYRVSERINSLSYEAHAKYTANDWFIAAKSVLGSNLTQTSGLGGFGIRSVDSATGAQKYTPIRFSSSWLSVVYGKRWKPGIFAGYARNLGTPEALQEGTPLYGTGTDLKDLASLGTELTYNTPHWKFGVEYLYSIANYGKDIDRKDGKMLDTHSVRNHRLVAAAMFMF